MDKASTGLFGGASGLLIALILQPLENIKMALMIPPSDLKTNRNVVMNLWRAQQYIAKNQGIRGFFKGTVPSMMRAGVGSFFFFMSLRQLQMITTGKIAQSPFKHFICSATARVISSVVSNPINLIETRFEMAGFHGYSSIKDGISKVITNQGMGAFLKGGLTSCIKEGVFAGVYYMLYTQLKDHGMNKITAGIAAGLLSTTLSHPLEIVRAKLQTQGIRTLERKEGLVQQIVYMSKHGGWFKGLAPRLVKKPLSNALTFILFETLQEKSRPQSVYNS